MPPPVSHFPHNQCIDEGTKSPGMSKMTPGAPLMWRARGITYTILPTPFLARDMSAPRYLPANNPMHRRTAPVCCQFRYGEDFKWEGRRQSGRLRWYWVLAFTLALLILVSMMYNMMYTSFILIHNFQLSRGLEQITQTQMTPQTTKKEIYVLSTYLTLLTSMATTSI